MNITEATIISENDGKAIARKRWAEIGYKVKWVMAIEGRWVDQKFHQWCPTVTEDAKADDWFIC